jgi:hypothetical protein
MAVSVRIRVPPVPHDLIDSSLRQKTVLSTLSDYFTKQSDLACIRTWASRFTTDNAAAFCEILTTILYLAGGRIEITPAHIESDAIELVLSEFQESVTNVKFDPPLVRLLHEKDKKVEVFWREIAEALISCNGVFSPMFGSFRQWLVGLNSCKIRIVRHSSSFCVFQLFTSVEAALFRTQADVCRLRQIEDPSELVKSQIEAFERQAKLFGSVSSHLYQAAVVVRARDVEPQLRLFSVYALTETAIQNPDSAEEQRLKYVGRALFDPTAKNRCVALRCFTRILNELPNRDLCRALCEPVSERIVALCDDSENSVAAAALEALVVMSENGYLGDTECAHAVDLLSDDSSAIRTSAAKFVAHHYFKGENDTVENLLKFATGVPPDDLPGVIASLYPYVKATRKWSAMCDVMREENDEAVVRLLAKILLYSSERALGRLLWGTADTEKRIRRMTIALVKSLPRLLKAFQADHDITVSLVESARLLNLDAVSETSSDHLYEQVLGEIRDLFLRSNDREIFTAAIASLYELSHGHHQLSEVARQALDRLAVECGSIDSGDISKFVAAARLVDVSDGGRVREVVIAHLETAADPETIADCIECLHYFYRWDIRRIRDNPSAAGGYRAVCDHTLSLFAPRLLRDDGRATVEAFKAISTVFALSPFLQSDRPVFTDELITNFFRYFHSTDRKSELFDFAQKPLQTHGIHLQFAPHVLVYCAHEQLSTVVRTLWKELAPYRPLSGRQVLAAFRYAPLTQADARAAARFLLGKVSAVDVLQNWFEDEDDRLIHTVVPFLFGITSAEAAALGNLASDRFREALARIESGEKPSQKLISAILGAGRAPKRPKLVIDDRTDEIELEEPEESFVTTRAVK